MEKRSAEDGGRWLGRQSDPGRVKTKFSMSDDPNRRTFREPVPRRRDDSQNRGEEDLLGVRKGRSPARSSEETEPFLEVELVPKETQTFEKRQDKGLQITMGRHVSKAPKILAAAGSQTDRPVLFESLKTKVKSYSSSVGFYLPVALFSFLSLLLCALLAHRFWPEPPPPPALPPPPPGLFKRLASSVSWFFHACRHCPNHR